MFCLVMIIFLVPCRQVAVITHYETVTSVQPVPALTTVTSIDFTVLPQVETVTKVVTEGEPQYFTDVTLVTHTVYNQPRVTITREFPYPYDSAYHELVTETRYVTENVVANQGPRLISTVLNTAVSYTPSYVTVTVDKTVPYTTTVLQQVPQTVTVPCGDRGIENTGNSYNTYN